MSSFFCVVCSKLNIKVNFCFVYIRKFLVCRISNGIALTIILYIILRVYNSCRWYTWMSYKEVVEFIKASNQKGLGNSVASGFGTREAERKWISHVQNSSAFPEWRYVK